VLPEDVLGATTLLSSTKINPRSGQPNRRFARENVDDRSVVAPSMRAGLKDQAAVDAVRQANREIGVPRQRGSVDMACRANAALLARV
jgi:hypothetical protein